MSGNTVLKIYYLYDSSTLFINTPIFGALKCLIFLPSTLIIDSFIDENVLSKRPPQLLTCLNVRINLRGWISASSK